jgi:hypothetical protein
MEYVQHLMQSVRNWVRRAPVMEIVISIILLVILALVGAFLWDAKNYEVHF